MIPIVSINDSIIAAVSFFIAYRVYKSYRANPSTLIFNFFMYFFFFGLTFLFWSIPGIFANDVTVVGFFNIFAYLCFYISIGFLAYMGFALFGKIMLGNIAFYLSTFFAVFFFIYRFIYFQPSKIVIGELYIFWQAQYAPWLRLTTGIASGFFSLVTCLAFYVQGLQNRQNAFVFKRAMWFGTGTLFLVLATVSAFTVTITGAFWGNFIGGILTILTILTLGRGVLLKEVN